MQIFVPCLANEPLFLAASMCIVRCRFALGAAGKLASIALEELSKPGKVDGSSSRRPATDAMPTSQPSR